MRSKSIFVLSIVAIVAIALSAFSIFTSLNSSLKVAYVDTGLLFSKYEKMEQEKEVLNQKKIAWQANIDTLNIELEKEKRLLIENGEQMSRREKQLKEQLIIRKHSEMKQYQQAVNTKAQEAEMEMNSRVSKEVNEVINTFAKDNNYDFIISATHVGNLAYAKEKMDITMQLLEHLNKVKK